MATKLTAEQRKQLRLTLRNVVVAGPRVFEAVENEKSHKLEYSLTVRFYKSNPEHVAEFKRYLAVVDLADKYFWGADADAFGKRANKNPYGCGFGEDEEGGYYYLRAKCLARPGVPGPKIVGRNKHIVLHAEDGLIRSGMIGNVVISVWCYVFGNNPGRANELHGLQYVDEGEPLAGGSLATDDDFDNLEDTGDMSDIMDA